VVRAIRNAALIIGKNEANRDNPATSASH
jgi:hypothetical protein